MIMKNLKRRRLNNKGFTLIELLAVVVILAVVMGIGTTSVLTAMNKARGGSLSDTAITISQAFNQKYTESLVDGNPTNVYGDVTGITNYDFSTDNAYYLTSMLRNTFNISADGYVFKDTPDSGAFPTRFNASSNKVSPATGITSSFVAFDSNEARFIVCMVANKSGGYYVNNYAVGNSNNSGQPTGVVFDGVTYTFANDTVFACSNGVTSWNKTTDTGLFTTTITT